MATCPHCKEQIEDGAKKCPHCGLWVTGLRRLIEKVRPAVELFALIAGVMVLVFMYCQNSIMKDTLNQMRQDLDLQKAYLQPKLFINVPSVSVADSDLIVRYEVKNVGRTDAESVYISILFKIPGKKDVPHTEKKDKITIETATIMVAHLQLVWRDDFYSRITVKYNWPDFNKPLTEQKYFEPIYQKGKYNSYQMSEVRQKEVGF